MRYEKTASFKPPRRFHDFMRRTTPVLPIEPAEPLSRGIGGRIDPSTQSSLVLAEVAAHTSFLPAQDDDTRVPLFADFRASRHIYLRRNRHHNPEPRTLNPTPCTLHYIFPLYATIELLQELSHRKKSSKALVPHSCLIQPTKLQS